MENRRTQAGQLVPIRNDSCHLLAKSAGMYVCGWVGGWVKGDIGDIIILDVCERFGVGGVGVGV